MPFSPLRDPTDLARAFSSFEAVWNEIKASVPEHDRDRERQRIADIVAGVAPLALYEEDLKKNALFHLKRDVAA